MIQKINNYFALILGIRVTFCCVFLAISLTAGAAFFEQKQDSQAATSDKYKSTIASFEKRVKEYVKVREQIEEKLPKLSKDSTPEQIQAHETAFLAAVRAANVGAKPGDIFTPDSTDYIRLVIKSEFKGKRLQELRERILEAETAGVP